MTSLTNTGTELVIIDSHVIPRICKYTQTNKTVKKEYKIINVYCLHFAPNTIEYIMPGELEPELKSIVVPHFCRVFNS